ncbi:MAG: lamin tail domain-containing protein [Bacteroidota bacterium]|nr:lamin tail domain-containing protein [Bacteroidota bacterium]
MKWLTFLLVALVSIAFIACDTDDTTGPGDDVLTGTLVINEFLASNDTDLTDENGDFDDWVELYNGSAEAIDIGGMYFSDDLEDAEPHMIPTTDATTTTIAAGGYLVLWFDKEAEQGVLHVHAKLSADGEAVVMFNTDMTILDSYTFEVQDTDVSMGRTTDGGDTWDFFTTPTPGATNE